MCLTWWYKIKSTIFFVEILNYIVYVQDTCRVPPLYCIWKSHIIIWLVLFWKTNTSKLYLNFLTISQQIVTCENLKIKPESFLFNLSVIYYVYVWFLEFFKCFSHSRSAEDVVVWLSQDCPISRINSFLRNRQPNKLYCLFSDSEPVVRCCLAFRAGFLCMSASVPSAVSLLCCQLKIPWFLI